MTGERNDQADDSWGATPYRYRPVEGDVVPAEQACPDPELDRRAIRLLAVTKVVLSAWIAACVVLIIGLMGARSHAAWGGRVALAGLVITAVVTVLGIPPARLRMRVRDSVGYPVPPDLADTVTAAHTARQVLKTFFTEAQPPWYRLWRFWQFRRTARQTWNFVLSSLEENDRARRAGNRRRWEKHRHRTIRYTGQLATASLTILGEKPNDE